MQKYFCFRGPQITSRTLAIPPHQRGVSRSSRTRGADAVDAAAFCVRRDCRAGRKTCERFPGTLTRDAFRVRQNRVVLTPRCWCQVRGVASAQPGLDKTYPLTTVAKETGHPAFPTPSRGAEDKCTARAHRVARRGRVFVCLDVIASAAKQSMAATRR